MATRLRTQTNPFQENRRTSVLNSAPQQRSAGLGTVPLAAAGEAARPQTQLGQQVPLAQPMQQRAQPVPVNAVQQQTGVPVGIDQAALASGQEKLRNLQPPAPGVPVQPGGQTTGGIPTGAVSADGIATAGPRVTAALARQQADAALAQRGEPGSRGEGLEQTINDIATAQERQLRETNLEAGERGIIRPFVQGLEGDIRGAAAEQAAPLQRELQGIREEEERQRQEEDRQFQRNMQERQLALQEMNIRSQIASRNMKEQAELEGVDLPSLTDGKRGDLEIAFKFQQNAHGMQDLLTNSGLTPRQLFTSQTADGRLFRSLRSDMVDLLARERTGAVVGSNEVKQFNRILGTSRFRGVTTSAEELTSALDRASESSDITFSTIDPSGAWKTYLTGQFGLPGTQVSGAKFTLPNGDEISPGEITTLPNGQQAMVDADGKLTIQ